jgi:hypothetical protein
MINKITIAILGLLLMGCCKPKPTKIIVEQNPLQEILTNSGATSLLSSWQTAGYSVNGFTFSVLVNGTINAFTIQLPASDNDISITLWDADSAKALYTSFLQVDNKDSAISVPINRTNVVIGKKYMISMRTHSNYVHAKANGTFINFPIIAGNIKVINSIATFDTQTMPSTTNPKYFWGDVSFNFVSVQ